MVTHWASATKSESTEAKEKAQEDKGKNYLAWGRNRSWQPCYEYNWRGEGTQVKIGMEKESVWKAGKERQSGDLKPGMHWHWRPEFLFAFGTAHPVTPQVYPHIRKSTSTHTLFALEDDPRRPRQEERTPSKELLTPTAPHLQLASHPASQK